MRTCAHAPPVGGQALAAFSTNWHYRGSRTGAKWAAILYTLLAAAELKGMEPKSWFKELLEKIADHPINELEELLPAGKKSPGQDTEAA